MKTLTELNPRIVPKAASEFCSGFPFLPLVNFLWCLVAAGKIRLDNMLKAAFFFLLYSRITGGFQTIIKGILSQTFE